MRWISSRFGGLCQHPGFVKFWAAQTVSVFGDQVTLLAVPLLAALTLGAGSAQMGLLRAAETGPVLVVGLFAGVWVDRLRRRPLLIAADLARAVLLLLIPLAAWLDALRIELLYAVSILTGSLSVLYVVARQSLLPTLVGREHLMEANQKTTITGSASEVAGPGLAGALVQLLGAPATVLVDAASFLASGFLTARVQVVEAAPVPRGAGQSVWAEIGEGLRTVAREPILRTLAGATGCGNLFENARFAILILYMTRDLGLRPGAIGLILGAGSVGYFAGAFLPGWAARRFGLGRAIVGGALVFALGDLLYPFAAGPTAVAVPVLGAALFLSGFGAPTYDVNQVSLRQAITPDQIRGRVNASLRVLIRGTVPLGALLGGTLGAVFGLRAVMVLGAVWAPVPLLWLWFSPVPSLRQAPSELA